MSHNTADAKNCAPADATDMNVSLGKITEDTQLTEKDTGWSEEQKASMRLYGYDSMEMLREWYS